MCPTTRIQSLFKVRWAGRRFCGDPGFSPAVGLFLSVAAKRTRNIFKRKTPPVALKTWRQIQRARAWRSFFGICSRVFLLFEGTINCWGVGAQGAFRGFDHSKCSLHYTCFQCLITPYILSTVELKINLKTHEGEFCSFIKWRTGLAVALIFTRKNVNSAWITWLNKDDKSLAFLLLYLNSSL